jgi:AcrR family transcriptional regulator
MKTRFIRARKPEDQEQRRAHLLKTARQMLEKNPDQLSISLNEIARRGKMAKSNVYRYFETREALLVALLWDEWVIWFNQLQKDINQKRMPLKALIAILTRTLGERRILCGLTSALPLILEQNLSVEAIKTFKRESLVFFSGVGERLHESCPELSVDAYVQLLHDVACLITGFYPYSAPAPAVKKALESEELTFFKRSFKEDLERIVLLLAFDLKG